MSLIFPVAILVLAAGITLQLWKTDRSLLSVAKRVAGMDCGEEGCKLVSANQYVWTDMPDYVNAGRIPIWNRCDLATGRIKTLKLTVCPRGSHVGIDTSPDGRRILCYSTASSRQAAALVNADTGRRSPWMPLGDVYHYPIIWMPDSTRWLSLGTVPSGYIAVYNADKPNNPTRTPFPEFRKAVWMDFEVARQDRLFVIDQGDRSATKPYIGARFTEYRLGSVVERVASHVAVLPFAVENFSFSISPNGDRIAWTCTEKCKPGLGAFLHRYIPRWPDPAREIVSLWISDLDGRHFRKIGHLPATDEDGLSLAFEWLPNGRQLSFVRNGALYIVAD